MSAFWGVLLVAVIASVVAWLLARGGSRHRLPVEELERLYQPSVPPEPARPPAAPPPAPAPSQDVTLRLLSERGRLVTAVTISGRRRRAVYRHVTADATWLFNAESEVEPGVWVYRRVGKERT